MKNCESKHMNQYEIRATHIFNVCYNILLKLKEEKQERRSNRLIGLQTNKIKEHLEEIETIKDKIEDGLYKVIHKVANKIFEIVEPRTLATKMADFDYNTALKLPNFNGEEADVEIQLRDFIDQIKFYHSILSEVGKKQLVKFILLGKVLGRAKTKLGTQEIESLEELEENLKAKFLSTKTAAAIRQELINKTQGRHSINEYAESLENLANQITKLQIKERNVVNAEMKKEFEAMNMEEAINVFKKGINREIRYVLEAKEPQTMQDALKAAISSGFKTDQAYEINTFQINKQNFNRNYNQGYAQRNRYNFNNNRRGNYNNINRNNYTHQNNTNYKTYSNQGQFMNNNNRNNKLIHKNNENRQRNDNKNRNPFRNRVNCLEENKHEEQGNDRSLVVWDRQQEE